MDAPGENSASGQRLLPAPTQLDDDRDDTAVAHGQEKDANSSYELRDRKVRANAASEHETHPARQMKGEDVVAKDSDARADATEKRIKRHWYPVLLFVIALNFFLLCSVFYIIYNADHYGDKKSSYLWDACLIIFVPLIPVTILLFSPVPVAWKERRDVFSERKSSPRWRNIVNILSAIASFIVVLAYLFFSAIPKYNSPIWISNVDFLNSMPVPALAFLLPQTQTPTTFTPQLAEGTIDGDLSGFIFESPAEYLFYNTTGSRYSETVELAPGWPPFLAIVANSSVLTPTIDNPLGSLLFAQISLAFNSSQRPTSQVVDFEGIPPPMILAAFDARLSLRELLSCGLVQTPQVTAFATNTFVLSVSQISDPQRKMTPQGDEATCDRVRNQILAQGDPPFAMFDISLSSSTPSTGDFEQDCDNANQANASCFSAVQLIYGSQFVTMQHSAPGKSKQSMWIDCGAIVGAVQFFAWFMLVFFQE